MSPRACRCVWYLSCLATTFVLPGRLLEMLVCLLACWFVCLFACLFVCLFVVVFVIFARAANLLVCARVCERVRSLHVWVSGRTTGDMNHGGVNACSAGVVDVPP